jgi:predicted ATP-dependent endonuclease of OLD family
MFKSLQLNTDITKEYITNEEDNILSNLSRINIFIGPNNSGKSRFMRGLFITKEHLFDKESINIDEYNFELELIMNLLNEYLINYKTIYNVDNLCVNEFNNLKSIEDLLKKNTTFQTIINSPKFTTELSRYSISQLTNSKFQNLKKELNSRIDDLINLLEKSKTKIYVQDSIYIPILRGLRSINYQNGEFSREDFYYERTIRDYFKGSNIEFSKENSTKSIYTGLSLYDDVQKLLLGNYEQRNLVKDFESFLSKTFFQNKEITIIPRLEEKDVYINISGEKEDRPIYNLGEGVQAIIILTYPLFFNKGKNLKVYIEEPDIYLHPGFQRILIETLLNTKGFEDFQYFFTTHSNHFLDMTLDYQKISVYKFSRDNEQFYIDNIDNPDITLLEHLGVKNSSVFLTNCTIWVEGITDRIYIRKYLELYQKSLSEGDKKYFEDVHYSFVEYGGNNITHWSFLDKESGIEVERLCGKLFLITDDDGAQENEKKGIRLQDLKRVLGKRYYRLKAREIENLLTKEIILETVKGLETEINRKNINYKSSVIYDDKVNIGNFILDNIKGIRQKSNYKKGKIVKKVDFAHEATKHLKVFKDLSIEAQKLTKLLYDFISNNNN